MYLYGFVAFMILLLSIASGIMIGYRLCQRRGAQWLVRPHSPSTLDRMPLPENAPTPDTLSVSKPRWTRSQME